MAKTFGELKVGDIIYISCWVGQHAYNDEDKLLSLKKWKVDRFYNNGGEEMDIKLISIPEEFERRMFIDKENWDKDNFEFKCGNVFDKYFLDEKQMIRDAQFNTMKYLETLQKKIEKETNTILGLYNKYMTE